MFDFAILCNVMQCNARARPHDPPYDRRRVGSDAFHGSPSAASWSDTMELWIILPLPLEKSRIRSPGGAIKQQVFSVFRPRQFRLTYGAECSAAASQRKSRIL